MKQRAQKAPPRPGWMGLLVEGLSVGLELDDLSNPPTQTMVLNFIQGKGYSLIQFV